ncbi:MAG: T9SS type A sorting domain-containing protein [Candidatus Cloacimonetes bacterium]|nr:T9SS type A sorting domain-containing protein [Candidatus Cloacimonadota bacterium]
MKKFALIIITFFVSIPLFAQIQWQENGIPIRQGVNIEWSRAAASLSDGDVVYVWSDTRRGDRDVWAQRVDINGNLLWVEEAVLVNGEINRQEDPVVISTGDGGVVIAWVDFRNEDAGDVYAQKLDGNGNLLWDTAGVPLCLAGDIQISLNIVNDSNDGAYVIWIDSRNPGGVDIYGTHIDSSGDFITGWDANGNPVASESGAQDGHTFWEDGSGGAILAWHDTRNADNADIYAQRISSDGTLLWNAGGTLICSASYDQEEVKMSPDGAGSFIFTWRDKRNENDNDIYAQRVDINGNLLWASDQEVCVVGGSIQENPRITMASDGGAIIVWEDNRNDWEFKDIYGQKIDLDGNIVWTSNGIPICIEENHQRNPRLVGDNYGGGWFVWDDGRTGGATNEDIYVQHVDSCGDIQFLENGKEICIENGQQFSPLIKKNSSGEIFVSWGLLIAGEKPITTGICIQIFDNDGNILLEENGEIIYYGLCGDALDHQILPNGENSVITWIDNRNPTTGRQIYMQVLNNDGSVGLDENGKSITVSTVSDQENLDAALYIESDSLVVVWHQVIEGFNKVFAQLVDMEGNSIWSDNGLAVCSCIGDQEGPKVSVEYVNDRSYDYYVGWMDTPIFADPRICGQKIRNGELQWGSEAIIIGNPDGQDRITDLVDRFFIWQNEVWHNYNIYVKLVNDDGTTADGWPENGLLVCGAPGDQQNAKGIMTPLGLLVVWEDMRDSLTLRNIYGQIVTYDGVFLWEENGIPLVNENNDQSKFEFLYCDNNIYLSWEDFRDGDFYDIYMQKYDNSGSELWTSGGVPVADDSRNQSSSSLVGLGNIYAVFWKDIYDSLNTDIYAQKINADGELIWDEELLVCGAIKIQSNPKAVTDEVNNAIVIWKDTRSSGKQDIYNIYAQKIELFPHGVDDNQSFVDGIKLYQNYPNPFNPDRVRTTISFLATKNTKNTKNTKIRIYNLKGQLVRHFAIRNPQSELTKVVWDGRDSNGKSLSNGIYFYRLVVDNFESEIRKIVILR